MMEFGVLTYFSWGFANGRQKYARYLTVFLNDRFELPKSETEVAGVFECN